MSTLRDTTGQVTNAEMQSLLAGLIGLPVEAIATWTIVVGLAGTPDVAVIPAPHPDGADIRNTIHLLAIGISQAIEMVAVNPDE